MMVTHIFRILYLLVKRLVSVLAGLIDSRKSLHQSSTIDSAKFDLSDSKLWHRCHCVLVPSRVKWLLSSKEMGIEHRLAVCLYELFSRQFVAPTLEVIILDLSRSSMNLTIFFPRFRQPRALTMASGSTLLNASSVSRKMDIMDKMHFLTCMDFYTREIRECSGVSTDLPFVYAYWDVDRSPTWTSRTLSCVLRRKEHRLICLWSFALVWDGFPALGIKIALDISQLQEI